MSQAKATDETFRKPWDPEEDQRLRALVAKHGTQQWALIASEMVNRNGKQCRERWHNQLDTALSRDGARARARRAGASAAATRPADPPSRRAAQAGRRRRTASSSKAR